MACCTGACMCHPHLRRPFDVEDVVSAVRALYADRLRFHKGTTEIAPGGTLHLIGGHSGGLLCLRGPTPSGSGGWPGAATLRAGGLKVAFQSYPCAHKITSPMLSDVDTWLINHCTTEF